MMDKKQLVDWYVIQGKSLQDIAILNKCSLHRVQYWVRKHNIKIRTRSAAAYLKNNPNGDPFKLKENLSKSDVFLLGLGLGLWWGEGNKRHQGAVRLGNSDPELIKAFVKFLTVICGVHRHKIRFGIQIFGELDPVKIKKFWRSKLGVPNKQFLPKVVVTEKRGVGTYTHKSQYGVLTLYCINIKLRKVMDELMDRYIFSQKSL